MKPWSHWCRYLAICVLLLFIFLSAATACSVSWGTVKVPTDFRIVVQYGATAISGVQVEVYSEADLKRLPTGVDWKPILSLTTSHDGFAQVKGLAVGSYLVETRGPGGGSAVYADVSNEPSRASEVVTLPWPFSWHKLLKTSILAGELTSNDPGMPFEKIHLELWSAGASSPLEVEDIGVDGRFQFNRSKPGIYVLRVRGHQNRAVGWQVEGDIPVELVPDDEDVPGSLSLRLGMTSCGIEYSSCPLGTRTPIATASRRVKVIYGRDIGSEAPFVDNAKYKLLNDREMAIAEGNSDHHGVAKLPLELIGKATLVVASPGLMTLRQPLDLLAPDGSAPDLVVSMTILGSDSQCSAGSLGKNATPQ